MKWEIPILAAALLAVVLFADASRIKPQTSAPLRLRGHEGACGSPDL